MPEIFIALIIGIDTKTRLFNVKRQSITRMDTGSLFLRDKKQNLWFTDDFIVIPWLDEALIH